MDDNENKTPEAVGEVTPQEPTPEPAPEPSPAAEPAKVPEPVKVTETPEYKGLQRIINRQNEELKAAKARGDELAAIKSEMAATREALDLLVESNTGVLDEDSPVRKRLEASKKAREAAWNEQVNQKRTELAGVLKTAGTDASNPKLRGARALWESGRIDEAIETTRLVLGVKETTEEPPVDNKPTKTFTEEEVQAEVDRRLKEAEVKARKPMEAGMPSGGKHKFTVEQIKDRPFWEAHKKEIIEAQEKGLIEQE